MLWKLRIDQLERELPLMSLSVEDVAKVALLARLRIEPGELQTFTAQINSIVGLRRPASGA